MFRNVWYTDGMKILDRSRVPACIAWVTSRKRMVICLVALPVLAAVLVTILCNVVIESNKKYIVSDDDTHHARVGIVLGAGVNAQGKPYKELQARLDVAAQAFKKGQVDKLIVSGDNRFKNYNEPAAMQRYLQEKWQIPADKIQPDYAGRSTYESCERAAKVFGLQETIIYSAGSHLPRAIYLCRHFGIETYGVSSTVEANNATRREIMARVKAIYNVYVRGEKTILGPKITI